MSNLNVRALDPATHSRQFDANCGKIRYVSDPQIIICQISFEIFDAKQIYAREKGKCLNSIKVFPFLYFTFLLKWNKQEIFNKRRHTKDGNCKANHILDRSSHQRYSIRKDVLRNFAKFTGKHLCQRVSLYQDLKTATLLKRDSDTGVFQ